MLRRGGLLLKWLACLGAGVVCFCVGHCEAYESWKGEATVKLNVRKGPGIGNPVITQIEEGAEVTVTAEKDGWYKVVIREDTYGFIGWAYGRFIADPKYLSQISSASEIKKKRDAAGGAAPVGISGDAPAAAGPPGGRQSPGGDGGKDGNARITHSSESGEGKGGSDAVAQRGGTQPSRTGEKNAGEMRGAAPSDTATTTREATRQDPSKQTQDAAAVPRVGPVESEALPGDGDGVPRPEKGTPLLVPSETAAVTGADEVSMQDRKDKPAWRVALGMVVKLVVVAFSCLALILAYRAWQMASAGSRE